MRFLFASLMVTTFAVCAFSQTSQPDQRKPVKPIRPFVVMPAQSLAEVQQKV